MPFPYSVKYSTSLKAGFGPENYDEILELIAGYLSHKSTQKIIISTDKLTFKADGGKSDMMKGFAKGVFKLSEQDYVVTLTYEYYTYDVFIVIILICIMSVISQSYWFGLAGFAWLCGGNWVITFFQHKSMFREITAGINDSFR